MSKKRPLILESIDAFFNVSINYVKAQLIFFGINFVLITAGLWWFGIPLPALIALGICALDVFPVVGSGLVFVPWSVVCFVGGNSELGWRLALLYIGLVVLRQILEPLIVGKKIGLNPIATFVASMAGLWLLGAAGLIVGPIIAATCATVYRLRARKAEKNTP